MELDISYEEWLNSFHKVLEMEKSDFESCCYTYYSELSDNPYTIKTIKSLIGEDIYPFFYGLHHPITSILPDEVIDWMSELNNYTFKKVISLYFNYMKRDDTRLISMNSLINNALDKNKPYHFLNCIHYLKELDKKAVKEQFQIHYNFKVHFQNIQEKIKSYDGNSTNDLLVYFNLFDEDEFEKYFDFKILPNASYLSLVAYFTNHVHNEEILKSKEFYSIFCKLQLEYQIAILSILQEQECSFDIIEHLHKRLNKTYKYDNDLDILYNCFEMDYKNFLRIYDEILNSSYLLNYSYHKKYEELLNLMEKVINGDITIDDKEKTNWYPLFMQLYQDVMEYSKNSIVNHLYDVSKLDSFINDMDEDTDYNILINTNEIGYNSSFSPDSKQIMDRFAVITPDNFSHTKYQSYTYGYYTDITPNRILLINPRPIDLYPTAQKKNEIGVGPISGPSKNYWIDMDTFNKITYDDKTFGSIIVETKKEDGSYIQPNCLISFGDRITKNEVRDASTKGLKLLHLKRKANTNMQQDGLTSHHYG